MRRIWLVLLAVCGFWGAAGGARGAEQELGLTLGALSTSQKTVITGGNVSFSKGTALQANYARTFANLHLVSLMGEVHFLASPQEQISSGVTAATKDIAVLYVTPGIRVKVFPDGKFSPWGAVGGGYSLYEQSTTTLAGAANGAPRHVSGGALQFGGGVDYKVLPHVSVRGEVREFYTGAARFNVPVSGGQFNLVAGGGIVLRFGK